ncbi:hypothetical protein [Litoribacter populi]|nr:hypothetical protein [Litoribacter populi]
MKALKIIFNHKEYILGVENGLTSFSIILKNEDEKMRGGLHSRLW